MSSLPRTQSKTKQVTFVKNGNILYPRTNDDYLTLRVCGIPVTDLHQDYWPLLERSRRLYGLNFHILLFKDLEDHMLEKAKSEFPYEITVSGSALTLKFPKKIKIQKLEDFVSKLRRWYAKHSFVLDEHQRRSAKSVRITLTKRNVRRRTNND